MATHFHSLKIKDIRTETAECVSIAFDIPAELSNDFAFIPGQNITIKRTIDGEEIRRSYSICSAPADGELRVAVKKVTEGRFSTHANHHLKKGDMLEVLPPTGKFFTELNAAHKKNYTAFAAGSGITPLLSIIKTTLEQEPQSSFTLIYGNRNRASIIFREELEAIKNRYMERFSLYHILSRESSDSPVNYGRIDPDKCRQMNGKLFNISTTDDFFLCGPEEMIFSVKNYLEEEGVKTAKIHFELFTTPGRKVTAVTESVMAGTGSQQTSEVTIKSDGVLFSFKLPYDSDNILDAALGQGADLPYACKGGVCCTCRARLLEGKVEMESNYALEKDELDAGFILTCQSHPRTERVVIDFDAR